MEKDVNFYFYFQAYYFRFLAKILIFLGFSDTSNCEDLQKGSNRMKNPRKKFDKKQET